MNAVLNARENRIHILYQFLAKNVMPWQWDFINYGPHNEDMVGFFYPEDINTIIEIMQMENKKAAREAQSAKARK